MRYDLIIVGGGLVGAGLAMALSHSSWRVALIDARPPCCADPRLFALNYSSCQFLQNIGIWPALIAQAAPIATVHISNRGHFGAARLNATDVDLPSLGHVVPADAIEAAMNHALPTLSNVTIYRPATLTQLTQQDGEARLTLAMAEGEVVLYAPMVIGADGTVSTVRTALNIATTTIDYEQSAIVTQTTLSRSHHQIAYERFTEGGAVAMLPLTGDRCATIWTADAMKAAELMALTDSEFLAALQTAFGYRLGKLCAIGRRYLFPLQQVRAEEKAKGCVLLLGNAAHTMHPIAAQGLNLALYEVAVLVENLMAGAVNLATISAKIDAQQTLTMGVSHQLADLFSPSAPLVSNILQLGLIGFDLITPIKKKFITHIMGRSGPVPRLLLSTNT